MVNTARLNFRTEPNLPKMNLRVFVFVLCFLLYLQPDENLCLVETSRHLRKIELHDAKVILTNSNKCI